MTAALRLETELKQERRALRWAAIFTTLTGLGLILGVIFQITQQPNFANIAFVLAYLAGGLPAGAGAFQALLRGKIDIDLLMVLAALAAALVGEARDGAILLFLFSLSSTLEDYALGNTKRAVSSLMKLRPDTANVLRNGETLTLPVERVELGEHVLVKPGERIPVDGSVVRGQSVIDQAAITGESVPVDKTLGDTVFAGTVNGFGVLEVQTTKRASESTLSRMVELVTEAQAQRAPSERFSEWFGQRYTLFVLLGSAVALGIFLLLMPSQEAFYKAATLLVVASPCAIVISVPAATLSALARAAKDGVLFKGGAALESFGNIKVLALDKTGTLTEGKMRVSEVIVFRGDEKEALTTLASLETHSEHPIAKSIVAKAKEQKLGFAEVQNVEAVPGKGVVGVINGRSYWAGNRSLVDERKIVLPREVEGVLERLENEGKTTLLFGDETIVGVVGISDTLRANAKPTLQRLRERGLQRIVMLTGDHKQIANLIGSQLGLAPSDIYAELLPEDKVKHVQTLEEGSRVAYIGDGVNDAAALASASVGVAMGAAGSDVAIEAADVALLADDLGKLPSVYTLAKRTNRIIKQNLIFALGIMVVMVLLTTFWTLPLPLGVVGHEGGTLLVVANGLRLLLKHS